MIFTISPMMYKYCIYYNHYCTIYPTWNLVGNFYLCLNDSFAVSEAPPDPVRSGSRFFFIQKPDFTFLKSFWRLQSVKTRCRTKRYPNPFSSHTWQRDPDPQLVYTYREVRRGGTRWRQTRARRRRRRWRRRRGSRTMADRSSRWRNPSGT